MTRIIYITIVISTDSQGIYKNSLCFMGEFFLRSKKNIETLKNGNVEKLTFPPFHVSILPPFHIVARR
jgi:hypothetical protein